MHYTTLMPHQNIYTLHVAAKPHRAQVFRDFIALYTRHHGVPEVRILPRSHLNDSDNSCVPEIDAPEIPYSTLTLPEGFASLKPGMGCAPTKIMRVLPLKSQRSSVTPR